MYCESFFLVAEDKELIISCSNLAAATVTFVEYAKVTSIVDFTCESHLHCFLVRIASQTP